MPLTRKTTKRRRSRASCAKWKDQRKNPTTSSARGEKGEEVVTEEKLQERDPGAAVMKQRYVSVLIHHFDTGVVKKWKACWAFFVCCWLAVGCWVLLCFLSQSLGLNWWDNGTTHQCVSVWLDWVWLVEVGQSFFFFCSPNPSSAVNCLSCIYGYWIARVRIVWKPMKCYQYRFYWYHECQHFCNLPD